MCIIVSCQIHKHLAAVAAVVFMCLLSVDEVMHHVNLLLQSSCVRAVVSAIWAPYTSCQNCPHRHLFSCDIH